MLHDFSTDILQSLGEARVWDSDASAHDQRISRVPGGTAQRGRKRGRHIDMENNDQSNVLPVSDMSCHLGTRGSKMTNSHGSVNIPSDRRKFACCAKANSAGLVMVFRQAVC